MGSELRFSFLFLFLFQLGILALAHWLGWLGWLLFYTTLVNTRVGRGGGCTVYLY